MSRLTTPQFVVNERSDIPGLTITQRKTARTTLLEAQAATELLTDADKILGTLSAASAMRALDWLIQSYL
jgi:hypothetical protein